MDYLGQLHNHLAKNKVGFLPHKIRDLNIKNEAKNNLEENIRGCIHNLRNHKIKD